MINYKKSIFAIIMALAVIAGAAGVVIAADLNWTADTAVTINSNNYTIRSGSAATSMEVGATTLTVTVPSGSSFALISTSGHTLSNDQSLILTCSSGQSTLTITGPKTVIITPSVAQACNTAGQGGSTSSGTTPTPTPTPTPIPVATPIPSATPAATPTPSATPASPASITAGSLIRSADAPEVYVIKDGKKVWIKTAEDFVAAGYNWTDIKTVAKSTIDSYATDAISPIVAPKVIIIATPALRIRSAGSTSGNILGTVKNGEDYSVIEEKNGWYKIKSAIGIIGWVSGAYTTVKTDGTASYPDGSLVKSSDAPEVYIIRNGKRAWIKTAEEFASAGYKWSDIVTVAKSVLDSYATDTASVKVIVISASSLRIRSLNSTAGQILGSVKENETYSVIEENSGWYKIKTSAGITGWVSGEYANEK